MYIKNLMLLYMLGYSTGHKSFKFFLLFFPESCNFSTSMTFCEFIYCMYVSAQCIIGKIVIANFFPLVLLSCS